jgi:hypothetical protein
MKVSIIKIDKIKQHEEFDKNHLKVLKQKISKTKFFKEPIVVDKKTMIVLDGHHRLNSCKQLGLKKIPCLLVDYINDRNIKVKGRRDNIPINKKIVVAMGLSGKVFPKKTTKHFIPGRVRNLQIPLNMLL